MDLKNRISYLYTPFSMIFHYLRIAWRNVLKYKQFSLLNLLGLTSGITVALLIFFYISDELKYDRFFSNYEDVYRITTHWDTPLSNESYATSPSILFDALYNNSPEIAGITRMIKWNDFTLRPETNFDHVFRETAVYYADSTFFDVFQFEWIAGNPQAALEEPGSFVLPKATAIKYFGQDAFDKNEIIGKNLLIGKDGGTPAQITGIIEDIPSQSHFNFELLLSANSIADLFAEKNWSWNIMHTYIRLNKNGNLDQLNKQLRQIVEEKAIPFMGYSESSYLAEGNKMEYRLQAVSDIHLYSDYLREMGINGNIKYIYTFLLIGIFILLIACINFMNLATAQSARRTKEIGVRKVLGSSKGALIRQFLIESFVFVSISALLSLFLIEALSTPFSWLTGKSLQLSEWNTIGNWMVFLGFLGLVSLVAGSYPAFYLSAFKPLQVLKGKGGAQQYKSGFRNGLVVFQFFISTALIICTIIVMEQVKFFQEKELGFNKEQVLIIQNDKEIEDESERNAFKEAVLQHTNIKSVSFSSGIPAVQEFHMRDFGVEGSQESMGIQWYQADTDFAQSLGLQLKTGRWFSASFATDTSAIVINEAAASKLGLTNPIGKHLILNKGQKDERKLHIVGIMQDFHFESFQQIIKPLVIEYFHKNVFKDFIAIRMKGGSIEKSRSHIAASWKKFEPGVPFNSSFLDEKFDKLYTAEQQLANVFSLFTSLAILIACLGLIGLVAFTAERRAKEIGIRKVMGAAVQDIILLLSKDFMRLVLIATLLAIPISYFGMQQWLQHFAYRIEPGIGIFAFAFIATLLIALVTLSYQCFKAARSNPIEALRDD